MRRVRFFLYFAIAASLALAAADAALGPSPGSATLAARLVQLVSLASGLWLLRRDPSLRAARRIGEAAVIVLLVSSIVSEVAMRDPLTLAMLCTAVAMGVGAFVPLGVWPQARIAGITALTMLGTALFHGANHSWAVAAGLAGIAGSVLAAREMTRSRALIDDSLASLHEAQRRFDHLAANAPAVFWWLGPAGDVRYVSPGFEAVWGRPVADIYSDKALFAESLHPDDRPRVRAAAREMRMRGFDEEFRIYRGDGAVRRLHTRAYVAEGMDAVVGMTEDITERRAMEDAVHASQTRYAELVEQAPDPMITLDGHGHLISANRAAERLLGRRAEDLAHRHVFFSGVVAPSSRRAALAMVRELSSKGVVPPVELELRRNGGETVPVESNQRVLRRADGSIEVEVILRDLTERRRAEEAGRLRAFAAHRESVREDERGRLAHRLHDDLAQPMAALGLLLNGLTRALPSDADGSKVKDMEALITTMVGSVKSMMADLRPAVLADLGLAAAARAEVRRFRSRTGIDCALRVIDTRDSDVADDQALAIFRILQEALANSAARGARHVRLEVSAAAAATEIRIEDDGGAASASPQSGLSWELVCLQQRAQLLGGALEVLSAAAGRVFLVVRIPDVAASAVRLAAEAQSPRDRV